MTELSELRGHDARGGTRRVDVVIVGAGFSGLYMLHRVRASGLSARVIEAADDVGGTWYWNRYPGARCDSESYYYSYSFSDELQQEWEWTERYPAQPEILRYFDHVASKFDLRRDIQFRTRVTAAHFDDSTGRWFIRTDRGEECTARFFITGVGCLSAANIPDIPGLDSFEGEWYHTGRWPHEDVDFTGKRVGVVGTGSTGIQAIPELAARAAHLTVFQRTANYSIPARNGPLDEAFRDYLRDHYHEIRRIQRETANGHPFHPDPRSALEVSEAERNDIYEAAWARGSLRFRAVFRDLLTNEDANETAANFIRAKIRETVRDPEVARILTPYDHPFAAKRPPIDTNYFETYNRDNVTLVDLRRTPVERIMPSGLRTTGAHHPLDALVFATGFDAMTGALLRMDIRGHGGMSLADKWADGPRTYLGLQIAGFPNMFTITGPGSPSVLTNMPTSIEQHVDWIARCLTDLHQRNADRIEATEEAEQAWTNHVQEAAEKTLLPKASTSWYLGANIPGKKRVFMPYAGGLATYARFCEDVAAKDYEGFAITSPTTRAATRSS